MSGAYRAVAAIFIVNGVFLASWVARIPAVAGRLELNNADVGVALLGLAVGSLSAFPFVGRFIDRFGSARVTTVAGGATATALLLPAIAPSFVGLFVALFVFGASMGAMDVAMNAQGVEVERAAGRSIMNGLHGFFSLGGFAGAAAGGLVGAWGVGPLPHFAGVAVVAVGVLLVARRALIPDAVDAQREPAPIVTLPPRALWGLGAIVFGSSIGEGAMADWSALYLSASLGTTQGVAATGYAVFSLAMLVGRFSGDRWVHRFGTVVAIRTGGAVAAVGLGVGLAVHTLSAALIGFGLVGLGLSVIVPTVFSAAGRHPTIPRGTAIAAVATLGYSGFLAGPPALGWVAEAASLRVALGIVVVLCAAIPLLSRSARFDA